LIALVLLVIAGTAAGFVLTRVESARDAWLVFGTGLALVAVTGVLALTRDRQRHAMPEVERYFTLAPEMVVLAGFDGYWKQVNPTVEALLGYTESDWLARPFMEFIHPDDRERSEAATQRVFEGATVRAFENRVLCKDGSYKWIEWTATPLRERRVIYAVGRDVTERRRSENEQAALQRIATLVAQEVPHADVFGAIAEEIGGLLGTEEVRMLRFDSDGSAVVVGASGRPDTFPLGSHLHLEGDSVALRVLRTGRPARFDDYRAAAGPLAETARSIGVRAVVGVPVFVERRLWGAISAGSTHDGPLPPDTEVRLDQFTKLMATAIANAEARAEVHRLADEQAALRRVAVLVAQQPSPSEVFTAVTEAVGLLLDADLAVLHVFPGDGTATTVASWGGDGPMLPIGTRFPLDGDSLAARIFESGAPARMHSDEEAWERAATVLAQSLRVRSAVGAPILVEGKLWGALMAATRGVEPWAENAETRIAAFTELAATAIANAESREALAELADEQAALRRVATMVARGARPNEVFRAVSDEVGRLFGTEFAAVGRFEPGPGSVSRFFSSGALDLVGADRTQERWEVADFLASAEVFRTGRSARADAARWESEEGETAERLRSLGIVSSVASPIVVEGELWGAMLVASTDALLPVDTEERLEKFTELVATAIANAESKSELAASRRRIVAASDETRRRIERDLHDGTQQRLVSLGLAVRAAEANLPPDRDDLRNELSRVAMGLVNAVEDLQEISRGIHPAILSKGGLAPALEGLAHRSPIPVNLELKADARLPEPIEVAAYYVASEALANAAKHAQASQIEVSLASRNGSLVLSIRDDGVGGAYPGRGSGLVGLQDRVEALGGTIKIDSSAGSGTCVVATLPIATGPDQEIENFLGPPQELGSPMSPA
jgi:PAS domain S-box-containing protein